MKTSVLLLVTALFAVACSNNSEDFSSKFEYTNLGGKHSVPDHSVKSFSHANTKITKENEDFFILGRSFFTVPWVQAPSATTARDGLGPLFNSNTCISCHPNHGSGVAVNKKGELNRSLLMRLSLKEGFQGNKSGLVPDPHYGGQLNINGNMNVRFEADVEVKYHTLHKTYPDGRIYSLQKPSYAIKNLQYGLLHKNLVFSPRIASSLIGLGELEDISVSDVLTYADPNDTNNDGISGKANYVYSPDSKERVLGRFSWKASAPTVKYQVARAMINDMGLSNPYFPQENCTSFQKDCLNAFKGKDPLDVTQERLNAVSFYTSNLAVPKQREAKKVKQGARNFLKIGCASCHVPRYTTKSGNLIHPFTDLLLHDMGKALQDNVSEFLAQGKEWRTAPLWGIGLRKRVSNEENYLHDGRAKSIEEAILWHGGEAEKSKQSFMHLAHKDRKSLLDFLHSL